MRVHLSNWEQMVSDGHDELDARWRDESGYATLEERKEEVEELIAEGEELLEKMGPLDLIDPAYVDMMLRLAQIAEELGNEGLREACDEDAGTSKDNLRELFGNCYDKIGEIESDMDDLRWERTHW